MCARDFPWKPAIKIKNSRTQLRICEDSEEGPYVFSIVIHNQNSEEENLAAIKRKLKLLSSRCV